MLNPDETEAVGKQTRLMTIIILALIAGPTTFLIFVLTQAAPANAKGNIAPFAAGFGALQAVIAVILPMFLAAMHRKAVAARRPISEDGPVLSDAQALLGSWQVRRIIAAALLEGAAFFNIVAYMLERQTYSLAIAIALIVCIATLIPLRGMVEQWLERELRTVSELRELER